MTREDELCWNRDKMSSGSTAWPSKYKPCDQTTY